MTSDRTPVETVLIAASTGVGGYLAVLLWAIVLRSFATALGGPVDIIDRQLINAGALLLGTMLALRVYLAYTDRTLDYLDIGRPTLRDGAIAVGAVPVLFGISIVAGALGVETAEHGLESAVRDGGIWVGVVLAVSSVVVVGPAEELLYRNLVQKTLADRFSTTTAVVGASVVFAVVHTSAYWSTSITGLLSAVGMVFVLSLVLGATYAYTDRLVVPAIAHGGYDAVVFLLIASDSYAV